MEQRIISWKHLVIHTLILVALHGLCLFLADKYYWPKTFVTRDFTLYMWIAIFFLDIFGKHHVGTALVAGHMVFVLFAPLYQLYYLNAKGISIKQVGDLFEYSRNGMVYDMKGEYVYYDIGGFYLKCIVTALIVNAVCRSGK